MDSGEDDLDSFCVELLALSQAGHRLQGFRIHPPDCCSGCHWKLRFVRRTPLELLHCMLLAVAVASLIIGF